MTRINFEKAGREGVSGSASQGTRGSPVPKGAQGFARRGRKEGCTPSAMAEQAARDATGRPGADAGAQDQQREWRGQLPAPAAPGRSRAPRPQT